MVRPVAAATGVVLALLAAGCGGGSLTTTSLGASSTSAAPTTTISALGTSTTNATPVTTQAPTTTAPTPTTTAPTPTTTAPPPDAATLSSELLTIGELPAGWSVTPSSGGSSTATVCNVKSYAQTETARAEVEFQGGTSGFPAVSETLASFTPALAATAYSMTVAGVNACKTFSLPINGKNYPGTVSPLSLGQTFGDQSAAWQFVIDSQGINLIIDQAEVKIGDVLMNFAYIGLSAPPDFAAYTGLLSKAVTGATPTA